MVKLENTLHALRLAIPELRRRHAETLALMPQDAIVAALTELGRQWRDPDYSLRREAETWQDPFPFAMVQVSLDALLASLTPDALNALLAEESISDAAGYPLIGHVIAGNTPLLAWVSVIRALLVRSASLVKLPSNMAARWAFILQRSLREVAPELAACVYFVQWPGGTPELDTVLCTEADLVMAHGSDQTLRELRALCPAQTPFIGYGHRVSFGVLLNGADTRQAALGFAKDVLLYDQGGCLSPQTIFVEGGWNEAQHFAKVFTEALAAHVPHYPLPVRAERAARTVRDTRALAWMEEGSQVWEDPDLRWTVIGRPHNAFAPSPTFGVVSVQPLGSLKDLPLALSAVGDRMQGCAVAGTSKTLYLPGVSRLCEPGELQAPPLNWRQDGRDVLRVLLPPNTHRADGSTTTCIGSDSVAEQISSVDAG